MSETWQWNLSKRFFPAENLILGGKRVKAFALSSFLPTDQIMKWKLVDFVHWPSRGGSILAIFDANLVESGSSPQGGELISAEQGDPDQQATCFRLQISLHAILKHCAPASAFSPLSNLWTSLKEIFVSRRIVRRSLKFDSIYDPPHQTAIPYQKQAEGCAPLEWFCKMFLAALAALYPTYAWSLSH